jgi:uncharacterized membrane protein YbhN (UPF0104 family)
MMLFNPGRVLFPLGALAMMLGAIDFRYNVIPIDTGAGLAGTGGLLCVWGAAAEHRIRQNRGPNSRPWSQIAISVILLLALAAVLPGERLLEAIRGIRWQILVSAIPIFVTIHCLGALKWRMLVNRAGAQFSLTESMRLYFAGLFGNLFLPSVVGGDVVMVSMAFRSSGSRGGILIGSLVNRILDLIALALLVAAAAVVSPGSLDPAGARILQIGVLSAIVVAGGLFLAALLFDPNRLPAKLSELYRKQSGAIESLRSPRLVAGPLAYSLLMQFCLLLLTAWIAAASGFRIPMSAWILAWPLAKLVAMVPVTLAGIGARELALVALLTPFGVEPEHTITVGLAWDAVMIGGSLVAGAIAKSIGRPGELPQE